MDEFHLLFNHVLAQMLSETDLAGEETIAQHSINVITNYNSINILPTHVDAKNPYKFVWQDMHSAIEFAWNDVITAAVITMLINTPVARITRWFSLLCARRR